MVYHHSGGTRTYFCRRGLQAHASSVHVAKNGDTFYFLSKQYGVNMDKLMKANPTIKATNIYQGLKINIPGTVSMNSTASAAPIAPGNSGFMPSLNVFPQNNVVEAWGKTFNYSKTLSVKATAYSAAASENGKWGPSITSGIPLSSVPLPLILKSFH